MTPRTTHPRIAALALAAALALPCCALADGSAEEFRIDREGPFAFAARPAVTRDGDAVTITFQAEAFCDATVAIENAEGRIVRHLASGVLGANAPPPFQAGTKKQALVWDSKDDRGQYVRDRKAHRVRVSLGLKPRFERTLYWSPYKRAAATEPILAACREGMLAYDGQIYDMVRLYDHDGDYVRTVYPFPADKVANVPDLHWHEFPQDGRRLPLKEWFRQASLLSSGDNSNHPWRGFGEQRRAHDGHGPSSHHAASAMAVHSPEAGPARIALAMYWINRLSSAGDSGGLKLNGPQTCFDVVRDGLRWRGGGEEIRVSPTSAAFAPDGRTLYLTGYEYLCNFGTGGKWNYYVPVVAKVDFQGDAKASVLLGGVEQKHEGTDDTHFRIPSSVDTDAAGRLYVADYMNDRVQIYDPAGKHLKTLAVTEPAQVAVHRRTGEVYVFSYYINNKHFRRDRGARDMDASLTRFGPFDKPGAGERFAMPVPVQRAALDSFSDEPTIWVYAGNGRDRDAYWRAEGFKLLRFKDGRLRVFADLGKRALQEVPYTRRVTGTGRNLAVNPATGELYVGDGSATMGFSWSRATKIDPASGQARAVELPFDTEQMAFDLDGMAYLRAKDKIVRYDPRSWHEVPWDYGEQHKNVGVSVTEAKGPGKRTASATAALVTPQYEHAPQGVFAISPTGQIVVPIKGKSSYAKTGVVFRAGEEPSLTDARPYQFQVYPGRSTGGLVVVFDDRGRLVHEDAIPGIGFTHGVKIDRDGNLYAMVMGTRVIDGKPYFNPATNTLMKVAPGKAKVVGTHNKAIPVPLQKDQIPDRAPDWVGGGKTGLHKAWVAGAEWFYGGVGYNGEHHKNPDYGCDCIFSSWDLDLFARSFAPEVGHCSVAVLDSNGNLVLRIGTYGNVDDGRPLLADGGPANPRPLGGDEVALFYAPHLAVHTDRRLFVADVGNERIVSVRLDYHADATVPLADK